MLGQEMTTQDDADTASAIAAADLVCERLSATPAACAVGQGAGIEEAQRRTLPTRHLCTALYQPNQEPSGWAR